MQLNQTEGSANDQVNELRQKLEEIEKNRDSAHSLSENQAKEINLLNINYNENVEKQAQELADLKKQHAGEVENSQNEKTELSN